MKPEVISIRLPKATKVALEEAAKEDMRSLSSMAEKIITEWLIREDRLVPELKKETKK